MVSVGVCAVKVRKMNQNKSVVAVVVLRIYVGSFRWLAGWLDQSLCSDCCFGLFVFILQQQTEREKRRSIERTTTTARTSAERRRQRGTRWIH